MNRNDAAPTAAPTRVGTIAPMVLFARPSAAHVPTMANRPTINVPTRRLLRMATTPMTKA